MEKSDKNCFISFLFVFGELFINARIFRLEHVTM